MKFHARLHYESKTSEHEVELAAHESVNGARRFRAGSQTIEVHSEEITPGVYSLLLNGKSYEAFVSKRPGDPPGLASPYVIVVGLRRYLVELHDPRRWRRTGSSLEAEGPQEIVAPMPGKIVKALVTEGQVVSRDPARHWCPEPSGWLRRAPPRSATRHPETAPGYL